MLNVRVWRSSETDAPFEACMRLTSSRSGDEFCLNDRLKQREDGLTKLTQSMVLLPTFSILVALPTREKAPTASVNSSNYLQMPWAPLVAWPHLHLREELLNMKGADYHRDRSIYTFFQACLPVTQL